MPLVDALTMASATPAAFLRLGHRTGRIAPGLRADLVHLDGNLEVRETWIAGISSASGEI
jgi:N-acetylglucosamine-6-phosphate deacetylase